MNDEHELNDEQLRLATSRSLPADRALDADTSAARDSFLAFGASIESAAGNLDEAALVERLSKTCMASPPVRSTRDWWPLIVTGALAAGMLLAVARIAMEARRKNDALPIVVVPNPAPAPNKAVRSTLVAIGPWSDPLDDEIALAAATIDQFSSGSRGFDGSLLDMNDRLEALSREMAGETL